MTMLSYLSFPGMLAYVLGPVTMLLDVRNKRKGNPKETIGMGVEARQSFAFAFKMNLFFMVFHFLIHQIMLFEYLSFAAFLANIFSLIMGVISIPTAFFILPTQIVRSFSCTINHLDLARALLFLSHLRSSVSSDPHL